MVTYTGIKRLGRIALDATTPVKLMTRSRGSTGYRVYNPDDTNRVLLIEVQRGSPAPIAADFAEALDFNIPANTTIDSGGDQDIEVYGLTSTGSISAAVSELFGRRDNN